MEAQKLRRPRPAAKAGKKRKRGADDGTASGRQGRSPSRKARRPLAPKKQIKDPKNADLDLDLDLGVNRAIARMDSHLLALYLARQIQRFGRQLSAIELSDLAIPSTAITDTSHYTPDRTLAHLPDFLETFCVPRDASKGAPNAALTHLTSSPTTHGAPHTIIVTGAGLRAADLVRAVRPLQTKTSAVAKLFAKHIKLAEAATFLQCHRIGIAVGTPARLIDLLDQGALSVAHLQHLVIDASHIDVKKRGVLDMQDTALPMARWLARSEFKARYDSGPGHAAGPEAAQLQTLTILFY